MGVRGAIAVSAGLLALAVPASAGAQAVPDVSCSGPGDSLQTAGANARFAQTFTVQSTGAIMSAEVEIDKVTGAGDYVIQIVAAPGGVPSNEVLASATVNDSSLPTTIHIALTATFTNPLPVAAGEQYAIVITRAAGAQLDLRVRSGDVCLGSLFLASAPPGDFGPVAGGFDMVFAVYVTPDTIAPETTITKAPKNKTKRKRATFEFASSEPGSTFACAVDDQALKVPCTSPYTVKVKKGKHTFQVRATDAGGNVDGSPATDTWKVKKKRKK
jgi:hypothetical protein